MRWHFQHKSASRGTTLADSAPECKSKSGYARSVPVISRVSVDRLVQVPFSVAHDYAEDFFREAERDVEVRVPLRDLFWAIRGKFRKPVRLVFAMHPDETEEGRIHDAMLIEWTAGTRLFPDFHGTLRLRIDSVESTLLTLEGSYRPPFGAAGRVFNWLIGRRIARSTMRELLERLALAMEQRELDYRSNGDARPPSGSTG
jgi:hypothetical protein